MQRLKRESNPTGTHVLHLTPTFFLSQPCLVLLLALKIETHPGVFWENANPFPRRCEAKMIRVCSCYIDWHAWYCSTEGPLNNEDLYNMHIFFGIILNIEFSQ